MISLLPAFCASRTLPVTLVTLPLLVLSGFITMCPPRCDCRPTSWEGSSDARSCHWRRADPAMELHPVAVVCLGDGGTGVDRSIPESDFWIRTSGRVLLEPRRH